MAKSVNRTEYKIPKMDCPAEEQMIRLSLEELEEIRALEFDLANRTLKVWHSGDASVVTRRLDGLGLGAKILEIKDELNGIASDSTPARSDQSQATVLWILLAINGLMFAVEIISGWLVESTGLIADSLDMLADAAVYGISLYAVGKAARHKLQAAHISGWLQIVLAIGALFEVVRRFVFGSEPDPPYMIAVATSAMVANVACLWLVAKHRNKGAHMKASWIFSTNDVIANFGVIAAGILVSVTETRYPDLVIGCIITAIVFYGALRILKLR